jgi:hypothetical protein
MDFTKIRSLNKNRKTNIKLLKVCVFILVIFLLASSFGIAKEGGKEEQIVEIGAIDRIATDEVVVGDRLYKYSLGIRFYTNSKLNTYANRSSFRVGTWVGFQLNDTREITAMWLESK